MLEIQYLMLNARNSILDARYSILETYSEQDARTKNLKIWDAPKS